MISGILRFVLLAVLILLTGSARAAICRDQEECLTRGKELCPIAGNPGSRYFKICDEDNFEKAAEYFLKACVLSSAEACLVMGRYYGGAEVSGDTDGDVPDFDKAIAFYRRACTLKTDAGCDLAISLYSRSGEFCEYVAENGGYHPADGCLDNARRFLEGFCNSGRMSACESLGLIYESRYRPRDPEFEQVYAWLKKACDGNSASACTELARIYRKQDSGNTDRYLPLLRKSCGLDNSRACGQLGELFLKGKSVPRDSKVALSFLEKACSLSDTESCSLLAGIYENGDEKSGIKADTGLSQKYRTRAEDPER